MGETRGAQPVLRSGARPGDVVAYRGRLGWSAGGLAVLSRGFRSPRALVEAYQLPQVPYGAGAEARLAGATAMIDVSDGLVADLGHVAKASEVCIDLDTGRFDIPDPLHAVAAATGADPMRFILTGGEDHALVGHVPSRQGAPGVARHRRRRSRRASRASWSTASLWPVRVGGTTSRRWPVNRATPAARVHARVDSVA